MGRFLTYSKRRKIINLVLSEHIRALVALVNREIRQDYSVIAVCMLVHQYLLMALHRDTTTYNSRMRVQYAIAMNQRYLLLSSIGALGMYITIDLDQWTQLFRTCEKWLELPFSFSSGFIEAREQQDYQVLSQEARLRNPLSAGRPRDASGVKDIMLATWMRLRGFQARPDPLANQHSTSTASISHRHGLWAIYQALWELEVICVPSAAGLARCWHFLPPSVQHALYDTPIWAIVDCTLIRIPQRMLSPDQVHDKAAFYATKTSPGTRRIVFSDNCISNLFVTDLAGRIVFADIGLPGSRHDLRQLRESSLFELLETFPVDANQQPLYKIVADDGFANIGMGMDSHFLLRKGFPPTCNTPAQQSHFSELVEFIRATVEHVNGDFKHVFQGIVDPSSFRPLGTFLAENEVAVLAYAFFKRDQPIAIDRYDKFNHL